MNRLSAIPKDYATLLEESSNRTASAYGEPTVSDGNRLIFIIFRSLATPREPLGRPLRLNNVDDLIVGSEAMAAGLVTRQMLRTNYVKLHHNVYARKGFDLDATDRARAAWLWSRRRATLAGHSAAAMHGTKCLPPTGQRNSPE
jgi:hypothetical protein